jgi:hypothetical protein
MKRIAATGAVLETATATGAEGKTRFKTARRRQQFIIEAAQ